MKTKIIFFLILACSAPYGKMLYAENEFSTDCYEVLTPVETIKRYPRMIESLQAQRIAADMVMPNVLRETLSELEGMKKIMKPNQKKQIESLSLIIRELNFIRDVSFAKRVLLSKLDGNFIWPGLEFFSALEECVHSYGLKFTSCGFCDGYTLSFSPLDDTDWYYAALRGKERIENGRWRGAYQTKEGYIMLPGIKCFEKGTGKMQVKSSWGGGWLITLEE